MDIFRKIFGLDRPSSPHRDYSGQLPRDERHGNREKSFRDFSSMDEDDDEDDPYGGRTRHFSVFTDPFKMHEYMEQQMSEMFDIFSRFPMFGSGHSHTGHLSETPQQRSIRDQMLKEPDSHGMGYEESNDKVDRDVDDKISSGGLDQLFSQESASEKSGSIGPFSWSSFSSVTVRKVQLPDGTFEEHRTTRDSSGKEETTVTRRIGDQSYSRTSITNGRGQNEVVEEFQNMDEGNLEDFDAHWKNRGKRPSEPGQPKDDVEKNIWDMLRKK